MSEFKVNTITNKDGSYGPQVCGITTFGSSGLQLPSGPTEFRGGRGRGVIGGGYVAPSPATGNVKTIDKIEISTTGDATDFGDLAQTANLVGSGAASATRGIIAGGRDPNNKFNVIDFITIQSKGNGIKFGELLTHEGGVGCSNSTRGIFAGGYTHPSIVNIITFITISTFGNDTDFGDLTAVRRGLAGTSSSTRAIFAGGQTPTIVNTIDFITIASTGNAQDFGDLNSTKKNHAACSDVHGGIGD